MSFHEKSAWTTLVSIVLVSIVYFFPVPFTQRPSLSEGSGRGLVYCLVAFVVIELASHLVLVLRSPKEARAPRDERERLINLKAIRLAAYVYVIGSFAAVFMLHLGANSITIANGVLLAFVIAEVMNYGARIVYHRRGL